MTPSLRSPSLSGFRHGSGTSIKDTERLRQPERRLIPDDSYLAKEALLPPKKRATSNASGHSRHFDDSSVPPKKRRINYVDTGSKDSDISETPVPHHHVDTVGTTAASPNGATSGSTSGSRRLMEEGEKYAAAAAAAPAKEKKKMNNRVDACSGVPPARGSPFDKVRSSMELRDRLEELGATDPEYVCEKMLRKSDVCRNQNRLLVSCKRKELANCPITRLFTDKEMRLIEDKWQGLEVTVFDLRGDKYAFTCKYLDSNGGYRFINQWGEFLDRNSLNLHGPRGKEWTRHVDVELWAFRSRRLPKLPHGEETGHPDGSLGLILVHYEGRRRNVDGGEETWKRALPVHQTKTEHMGEEASAPAPVAKEEKPADAGEEQREAGTRGMTMEEMAAMVGKDTVDAAIGILKLTRCQAAGRTLLASLSSPATSSKCN